MAAIVDNDHKVAKTVKSLVKAVKQLVTMVHHAVAIPLEDVDDSSNGISASVNKEEETIMVVVVVVAVVAAAAAAVVMEIKKTAKMVRMGMLVDQEIDAFAHAIGQTRLEAVIRCVCIQ